MDDPSWRMFILSQYFENVLSANAWYQEKACEICSNLNDPLVHGLKRKSSIKGFSCDFTLKVQDRQIHVHKSLLMLSSEYFRCMLENSLLEKETNYVHLPEMRSSGLFVILKYIYTGVLDLCAHNFLLIWELADYFQLYALTKFVLLAAQDFIKKENCVEVIRHALALNLQHVVATAMCQLIEEMRDSKNYNIFETESFEFAKNFVGYPYLEHCQNIMFFQSLNNWCKYDSQGRYRDLSRLLTVAELCHFLKVFPETADHLTLHPESTIEQNHEENDSFLQLFNGNCCKTRNVMITFGGESNNRIISGGESNFISMTQNSASQFSLASNNFHSFSIRKLEFLQPFCETICDKNNDPCFYCRERIGCNTTNHWWGQQLEAIKKSDCRSFQELCKKFTYEVCDKTLDRLLTVSFLTSCKKLIQTKYDSMNMDRAIVLTNMSIPVAFAASARTSDESSLIVLGGLNDLVEAVSDVRVFDVQSNKWSSVASLPEASFGGVATCINGVCYYMTGARFGEEGCLHLSNSLWCLKPGADHWECRAPLPAAVRMFAAAAAFCDLIVVTGGTSCQQDSRHFRRKEKGNIHDWLSSRTRSFLKDCWLYDPRVDMWSRIADLQVARAGHGISVCGGRLIVVAGEFELNAVLSSTEIYDAKLNIWRPGPDLHISRSHFGVSSYEEGVVVAGGWGGNSNLSEVEIFSNRSMIWRMSSNLCLPRWGCSLAVLKLRPNNQKLESEVRISVRTELRRGRFALTPSSELS